MTERTTFKSICIVATCTLAMILNLANSSVVSIALPTIGRELGIPQVDLKWAVIGYPLSSSCLLLMFGRIADLYGRKKLMLFGFMWLLAFTLGSAFSPNAITLFVLRAFQGIGTAAIIPSAVGVLAASFPPSTARSTAFATYAAGAPIGGSIGNLIGGAMTQTKGWRSPFYLLAGLTVVAIAGTIYSVENDAASSEEASPDRKIDWIGVGLVTVGLVLLFFVLGEGESAPKTWTTPYLLVLLILSVMFLIGFGFWQTYLDRREPGKGIAPPLLRPSVWGRGNGRLTVIMLISFLTFANFLGWLYWVQLFYQNYMGYSPLSAAIRLIPMTVVGLACNIIVALLVGRISVLWLIVSGTGFTACASLLFALIVPGTSYWAFEFLGAVVSVAGADFVFAAGSLYVAKVAEPGEQSVVGALFQTMTQLGTSFGITISTVVYNRVLSSQSRAAGVTPDPTGMNVPLNVQLNSYKAANWSTFAMGVLGTALALAFFRGVGVVGERRKNLSADQAVEMESAGGSKTGNAGEVEGRSATSDDTI